MCWLVRMDSAQSGSRIGLRHPDGVDGEDAAPTGLDGQTVTNSPTHCGKQWAPATRAVSETGRRPELRDTDGQLMQSVGLMVCWMELFNPRWSWPKR